MSVLVLNASYEVLGVTTWKRAIWLVGIGRCDLTASSHRQGARSSQFHRSSVFEKWSKHLGPGWCR